MTDPDHPLFDEIRKVVAVPTAEPAALVEAAVLEAAFTAPATRAQILDGITSQINADDGVSLRRKAQLFRLRREYSDVHHKLLSVSR